MAKMNILILSDLNWHSDSKRINREDILLLYESQTLSNSSRFITIANYYNLVLSENPDLVIFAGDVTGDGSCGHGFQNAFFYLLTLLQLKGIMTLFLRGDNDLETYYASVTDNISHLPLIHEFSDTAIKVQGLRILGIGYDTSADKKSMQAFLDTHSGKSYDLIVCHAQLKRRTALLKLKCKCLITGHFDNKLFKIGSTVFLSHSNDSEVINYSTISKTPKGTSYTYTFRHTKKRLEIKYRLSPALNHDSLSINDVPVDIREYENLELPQSSYDKDKNALALAIKFLRGQAYKKSLKLMYRIKSGKVKMDKAVFSKQMKEHITAKHRLSRTMLADYLGREVWKYLK